MGLDYGLARCGIAVQDDLGMLAHARQTLPAKDLDALVDAICDLARDEDVTCFVLGLPLSLRGHEGEAAERTRAFAQVLAAKSKREVILWDERLTTVSAHRDLRNAGYNARSSKAKVDAVAAVTILQSWLDRPAMHAKPED
jgi:putative Holliday junction resolvase